MGFGWGARPKGWDWLTAGVLAGAFAILGGALLEVRADEEWAAAHYTPPTVPPELVDKIPFMGNDDEVPFAATAAERPELPFLADAGFVTAKNTRRGAQAPAYEGAVASTVLAAVDTIQTDGGPAEAADQDENSAQAEVIDPARQATPATERAPATRR